MNTDGTGYAVLKHFSPYTFNSSTNRYANSDGGRPRSRMELSGDALYGTANEGGSFGYGTVFRMNTDGTGYTVLKHCNSSDGTFPGGRLALSSGVLYGTTSGGGSGGKGTVFKVNANGTGYTVLKHFNATDGWPDGPVLSGSTLYGTTYVGGNSGSGTVFRLEVDGTGYTILKHFSSRTPDPSSGANINSDGASPWGGLTLSGTTLYGTCLAGGKYGRGTIFQVNTDGSLFSTLHHVVSGDGTNPPGGLALSGSTLYGTMSAGGGGLEMGTIFKLLISEEATLMGMATGAGTARITFGGLGGLPYEVRRSTDLLNWTLLGSITMPDSGEFTQVDNNAPIRAFYRAARVP